MNIDELYHIADEAVREEDLTGAEIPAIQLYVDQIINLVSDKAKTGSPRYQDKQLTKTMINNYSKEGLITPVKGKKYDKEQILQMLSIYTLKSTLSINEIKRLLQGMYAVDGFDAGALTEIYDKHLEIKNKNRDQAVSDINEIIENNSFNIEDDIDYVSLVCVISALSAQFKNIAQAMIDAKFPLDDNSSKETLGRREQRIERKKEKIEAKVAKAEAKLAKVEAKSDEKMAKVVSKAKRKNQEV
jgi:hypothetical protein